MLGQHHSSTDDHQQETQRAWIALVLGTRDLNMNTLSVDSELGRKKMEKGHSGPSLDQSKNRKILPADF